MTTAEDLQRTLAQVLTIPVIQRARELLKTKLPQTLQYHVASHTDDVMQEALLFGMHDALSTRELELLAVAAAYHDVGFIEAGKENELIGAEMAEAALRKDGSFQPEEIDAVKVMVLDTQVRTTEAGMRQVPTSKLSNYLLDGDVSNLGREDFFEKAELVRQEVGAPRAVFYPGLVRFLGAHRWYSPAAQTLRNAQKQKNLKELQRMLLSGKFL